MRELDGANPFALNGSGDRHGTVTVIRIRQRAEWIFLHGKDKTEKIGIRNPAYSSIQELIDEANACAAKKKSLKY